MRETRAEHIAMATRRRSGGGPAPSEDLEPVINHGAGNDYLRA